MDSLSYGLAGLDSVQTKDSLVDALWNLRDSAYDHPEVWQGFSAESLFQSLAAELEEAPTDDAGQVSMIVIARVLGKALDPRPSAGQPTSRK